MTRPGLSQADTTQDLTDAECVRAAVIDGSGRPMRTVWSARNGRGGLGPPLSVLVHHHTAPSGGLMVTVDVTMVADDRVRSVLAEAATLQTGGLALDVWIPETAPAALAQGHLFQHWLIPWLIVGMPTQEERARGVFAVVDDPGQDVVARCVAMEHPARATQHDLWWPRHAPEPVRAYQWIREPRVPPIPL